MTTAVNTGHAVGEEAPVRPGLSPAWLLAIGSALMFMTFMRYSLAAIGWVAFAPFLLLLHERGTWRRHLALLGTMVVAFVVTVSKMATWEIPWAPVPMFAVPIALSYFVALAVAAAAHRRLGVRWGIYSFASMVVVMGWVQYSFTEGSSWAVLAHTQLDNLPFLQLAALTGLGGMSFVVALGSALIAGMWSVGVKKLRIDLAVFGLLVVSALAYGQLRLGQPAPGAPVRVGSVVSPVTHKEFYAARSGGIDTLRSFDDELFARTERAAELGAEVIVWNELATLVMLDGEPTLTARGRALAMRHGVMLLMSYGAVDSMQPFHYINKYRLYLPDGTLSDEYAKRHPVPGDAETPATAHAKVVAYDGIRYSGAICYDYGFPEISLDNARDGADVALVPSSDWGGIDPGHARMALLNAVAVGLPMVRPVRAATSIASDQYGRLLGTMRADAPNQRVMVVEVPTKRVPTLYTKTGELVPILALGFCVLVALRLLRSRHKPREQ
jgi:apolipoprotein N-acyltransferase